MNDHKDLAESTIRQYISTPRIDPYSFAMRHIMTGLKKTLPYQGRMSEEEASLLNQIYTLIEHRDPASLRIRINKQ